MSQEGKGDKGKGKGTQSQYQIMKQSMPKLIPMEEESNSPKCPMRFGF